MYQEFARVYDEFMETVPYAEWADHIEAVFRQFGMRPELVLDMACGTGGLTVELSRRGYDMIGTDLSIDMLEEAQEKAAVQGENILFLEQDMRELELFGEVEAVVCTCDSMNYILEPEDLQTVFDRVAEYLLPDGLFIFDMNTSYKYRHVLGDNTYADTYEDAAFIWQNEFHEDTGLNEYLVNFFIEEEKDTYRRYQELHVQKAYERQEITAMAEKAGLAVEAVYDGYSFLPVREDSERFLFVTRNRRKGMNENE